MGVEETRKKIINVANTLFGRFGFHKVSMDEVARIARKAKGSLYYHFSSKEALFHEVLNQEIQNLKEKLTLIIDDTEMGAVKKARTYVTRKMELLEETSSYKETLRADFHDHYDFVDDIRDEFDRWEQEGLSKIFKQGIEQKEFIPIEDVNGMISAFQMILKSLEIPFFLQNNYYKHQRSLEELMKILTRGIAK
jgi:AcrR family transcriptional regulator